MFLFCLVFAMFFACLFICALWSPAGKGLPLGSRLWCLLWVCHFPIGILSQMWYLIVTIPDLCTLLTLSSFVNSDWYCLFNMLALSATGYCEVFHDLLKEPLQHSFFRGLMKLKNLFCLLVCWTSYMQLRTSWKVKKMTSLKITRRP